MVSRETEGSDGPEGRRHPGVRTGTFLPSEIRHSVGMARLGDKATNAKLVGHRVQRLLGFWFAYNALGGLEAMIGTGLWPKSTAYKQLNEFREFYGCEPYELESDLAAQLASAAATWPEKYADGLDPVIAAHREKHGEPVQDRRRSRQ